MTSDASSDLDQLMREFRRHHDRLRMLADPSDVRWAESSTEDLIREIDEIGERFLVADEELRVQSEELASAQSSLTDVLTAYEHLFMDAPVPFVQTDLDGVILRTNRAASKMIAASTPGSARTLVGLLRMADRAAVRSLLSQLRMSAAGAALESRRDIRPVEVSLAQAGGTVPVVLSAQLTLPTAAATLVHWEIRPRTTTRAEPESAPTVAPVAALSAAVQNIAAAGDLSVMADRIITAGAALIPGAASCALMLRRARDRVEVAGASDAKARLITDLQRNLRQGPALDALRAGVLTRTDSLVDDHRWPRLAQDTDLDIRSVLAVPLTGPRGPFGVLVCYSAEAGAFGFENETLATALAGESALVYSARELEGNLRAGMETRERIGQAVGVLMERHRLSSKQAFDLLVYVSQRTHRKLRDIAIWITDTGEDPHELLKNAQCD